MGVFQAVIPFQVGAVLGVGAHQLDRFRHDIHGLSSLNRDPVFRFRPENPLHCGHHTAGAQEWKPPVN